MSTKAHVSVHMQPSHVSSNHICAEFIHLYATPKSEPIIITISYDIFFNKNSHIKLGGNVVNSISYHNVMKKFAHAKLISKHLKHNKNISKNRLYLSILQNPC